MSISILDDGIYDGDYSREIHYVSRVSSGRLGLSRVILSIVRVLFGLFRVCVQTSGETVMLL